MYRFFIPFLLGFALAGASAFTAAYSRLWGERAGQLISSLLRNVLGIPLWFFGFVLAWLAPALPLFSSTASIKTRGGYYSLPDWCR